MGLIAAAAAAPHESFTQTGFGQLLLLVGASLLGALFLKISSAAGNRFGKAIEQPQDTAGDVTSFSVFFFDQAKNPRTGTPGSIGWTSIVNGELENNARDLAEMREMITTQVLPQLDQALAQSGGPK